MIWQMEILRIVRYKAFGIAKNPKYDGYQCGLSSMIYNVFNKRTSGSAIKNGNISNKELAQELHKPIIKNFNSTIRFYRQYFGCRSSRYVIDK